MNTVSITDFLPKYPNIENTQYGVLNPYDENFYSSLYHKKEFYENKLEKNEEFPKEKGMFTKYQKTIANYLSSHTPYDSLILVHSPGLGKTCSTIGAIEQIINEDTQGSQGSSFTGALIFAKGTTILDNFTEELLHKCTSGQYIPENFKKLTELEKAHRIKKKIAFYQLKTFAKFAKKISKMKDSYIIENFSNKIIVVDEVHNLRIQDKEEGENIETYNNFHRFLHLVKNCKILFLSGTPMKDSIEEIASVSNLILPLDNQFPTGQDFLDQYTDEQKGVYKIKPEKIPEFKAKLKGKISFLKEAESSVQKDFIGESKFGDLKHFIVSPETMSSFQSKHYKNAYDEDKGGKAGVYNNIREASLFVYPDGSYGKNGFNKYISSEKSKLSIKKDSITRFKLSKDLLKLQGENDIETLKNIKTYSCTYYQVIKNILETNGNCFIYSSLVQGSGAILFALLLELFSFSKANGKEKEPGLRYVILTNKTVSSNDIRRIRDRFNKKDNMKGEFIKVIIGSRAVSEGFSFRNVVFEAINTPHWNYSETFQALARGIRMGSHNDLIEAGETPIVKILQPVAMPKPKYDVLSVDLHMYKTSEDKDISIRNILRLLMENAFDCALNYIQNYVKGKKNSRECDYTTCNYTCDGFPDGIPILSPEDLDYSTYQLYYSDQKSSLIRKKIENIVRQNKVSDLKSIIKNLKTQFSEEEIKSALYTIEDVSTEGDFTYRMFLDIYSRTPVKKIINNIEELFRKYFKLNLQTIIEKIPGYTIYEILTALRTIINDSLVLTNKYGLSCYLREENNVYFLVNNLSINVDYFTEYYTEYPFINSGKSFSTILDSLYSLSLPKIVRQLCSLEETDLTNEKIFNKLIKSLPAFVQEILIEASILAKHKGLDKNIKIREAILTFFESYIKKVNTTYVSSLLQKEGVSKCLDVSVHKGKPKFTDWKECTDNDKKLITQYEATKQLELRENNPYGIMGKYNPENDAFCIIDFLKESKIPGKVDKRLNFSGKVCGAGGWKLPELMYIAIERLKVDPPENFQKNNKIQVLRKAVFTESKLTEIFSEDKINEADKDELRRMLYWGTTSKDGGNRGIKTICEGLRLWFDSHGLLEKDNQCGVQGKRGAPKETKEKEYNFRIETYVPNKNKEEIQNYSKDISKLMKDCFGIEKYKIPIDDNLWIMVFSRKKLVGFITIDDDSILWNVCVAKNYRRQGIASEAMKQAVNHVCSRNKTPTLLVSNKEENLNKLIKMYTSWGFEVLRSDSKNTYMTHNCSK